MMLRFKAIVRLLNRVAAWLAAAALIGLVALITLQVVLRRLFNAPIVFTDEFSGYLLVAITVLGLSYALQHGDHIQVEMGLGRLPPRVLRWFRLGWCTVGLVLTVLLTVQTTGYVLESIRLGSVSIESQVPLAPVQALVPFGFILLSLELVVQFLDALQARPS